MSEPPTTHSLRRTSPKGPGQPFIGRCVLCGEIDLPMIAATFPCPNPEGMSQDEAVLDAMDGNSQTNVPGDSRNPNVRLREPGVPCTSQPIDRAAPKAGGSTSIRSSW